LGARLAHIAPGVVRIVLPARPEMTQQHGHFHAGATSAIADSADGYAAFTLFPADTSVLTVDLVAAGQQTLICAPERPVR